MYVLYPFFHNTQDNPIVHVSQPKLPLESITRSPLITIWVGLQRVTPTQIE
jgi:hypothetical protein